MGKEMMRDLEELQKADDSFRRGDASRKEYRAVESAIIRKVSEEEAHGEEALNE